jgi:hypothetical protein
MTSAINIQCHPTPEMWLGAVSFTPPPPPGATLLTNESGNILTDESGDQISTD